MAASLSWEMKFASEGYPSHRLASVTRPNSISSWRWFLDIESHSVLANTVELANSSILSGRVESQGHLDVQLEKIFCEAVSKAMTIMLRRSTLLEWCGGATRELITAHVPPHRHH